MNSFHDISLIYSSTCPQLTFYKFFCNSRVSAAKVAPYQVFTSQNYPYLQKHSGVPWTEIATLKRAFFVEPLGGGWWSEPPGRVGWVFLTPHLNLKNHVSKHTQLRNVITQCYYATP